MIDQKELDAIVSIAGNNNCFYDEPMKNHTTFRIGGNADLLVMPQSEEQVKELIGLLKKSDIPFFVMGNGSNLLVSDDGFKGVVVKLGDNISGYRIITEDEGGATFEIKAGMKLSSFGNDMIEKGYTGFEFATGIPGNFGGAIRMNAGAYGGEMKDIVVSAKVLDSDLEIRNIPLKDLELGYRTSSIVKNDWIVLSVIIKLLKKDSDSIRATVKSLAAKRREKQPLEFPSAGSTFKRPVGYFAAKLIEDAGLKGLTVGGAAVSDKHAGFVVNLNNASASDVIMLTDIVRDRVYDKFGVRLELEIIKVGF